MSAQVALRRRLGILLGALLSLSLALAGATVVLATVDSLLLNPLALPEADRVTQIVRYQGPERIGPPVSGPVVKEFLETQKSFEFAAAATETSASVIVDGKAQSWSLALVTGDYFDMLGVQPALGRWIKTADTTEAASPVAVISHQLWTSRFFANPEVIGKQVMIFDRAHVIVGVAPVGLKLMSFGLGGADAALPIVLPADGGRRGNNSYMLWGRLAKTSSLEEAQAEMRLFAKRLATNFPDNHAQLVFEVEQVIKRFTRRTGETVQLLAAAIGLLLVVGSASLVNLLLAHVFARRREFAIRMALGAPRIELIARIAIDAAGVALAAAGLGIALAFIALRILSAQGSAWIAHANEIHIGAGAITLTLLIALFICALATATASRHVQERDLRLALRGGSRSGMDAARQRIRRALIVVQIGLSLLLMIGAGLLTESLRQVLRQSVGFESEGLLLTQLVLPSNWVLDNAEPEQNAKRDALASGYMQRVEATVRAIPGVVDAGFALRPPVLVGSGANGDVSVVGEAPPLAGQAPIAEWQIVTPAYLTTLGTRLEAGSTFSAQADANRNQVLVNRSLVDRLFGARDPIGRELNFGGDEPKRIIGVLSNVQQDGFDSRSRPEVYLRYQGNVFLAETTLVLRAKVDPESLIETLRDTLGKIGPEVAIVRIETMNSVLEQSTAQRRFLMSIMQFFSLTAVAIAVVGLFALISYSVAQRRGEFGVRMALGAAPSDVRLLVLKEGAVLVGAGIALGLLLAWPSLRLLQSWLFSVNASDPGVAGMQIALLAIVSGLVLLFPMLQAGKLSPAEALRND